MKVRYQLYYSTIDCDSCNWYPLGEELLFNTKDSLIAWFIRTFKYNSNYKYKIVKITYEDIEVLQPHE